jgi:hypothetical protein
MALELAFSGTVQVLLATGAGAFALVIGGIALWLTLGEDDRGALLTLARHPVRTIFTEDEAPELDE